MAPKLVYIVLKMELLNLSETATCYLYIQVLSLQASTDNEKEPSTGHNGICKVSALAVVFFVVLFC